MKIRQSDISTWQRCPLQWKFQHIDGLEREQSGSLVFGTIVHDCVLYLETTRDLEGAISRFKQLWVQPDLLPPSPGNPPNRIDYYVRGTNWKKFAEKGERILRDWWSIIQWDTDLTLAREFTFDVPIGDGHTLHGTVDVLKVCYRAATNEWILKISDYKTNNKVPTYDYLEENIQFSAYGYASTCVEFWIQLALSQGKTEQDGIALYEQYRNLPRYGEWVQLSGPKRMDAGVRTQRHYNRLFMAVDALALSVAMRIFVPNISGETCRFCEFRRQCGLPEIED